LNKFIHPRQRILHLLDGRAPISAMPAVSICTAVTVTEASVCHTGDVLNVVLERSLV